MPNQTPQSHSLCIEERAKRVITGVEDVDCFSESTAVISTVMGALTVSGSALKVARLDLESGAISLEGQIDTIEYGAVRKSGLMSRLFR